MAISPRVITLTKTNRAGVVVATAYAITAHDLANLDGDRGGYLVGDFTDDAARSRTSPPSTPDSSVFIMRDVHGEFLEASEGGWRSMTSDYRSALRFYDPQAAWGVARFGIYPTEVLVMTDAKGIPMTVAELDAPPKVPRVCGVPIDEVRPSIEDAPERYECELCSAKSGAPALCTRCLAARSAAGETWIGPRWLR